MHGADEKSGQDDTWKDIQQTTFIRWANDRLDKSASGSVTSRIENLQKDLSDGVLLIRLVESLAGSKFPTKFNQKPTSRSQKLENVTICLEYLERQQGVKLVNIDSGDIVDGKSKLILGLMWTLILHYSISSRSWKHDSSSGESGSGAGGPRQRLLTWINDKLESQGRKVSNFTRDWNDGKTLGALVNSIAPGLCADWRDWDESNNVDNTQTAMAAATSYLNISELITATEMCDEHIDEYSVMTYLSQFPSARLAQDSADCIRATNVGLNAEMNRMSLQDSASHVTAFGDGLSRGYVGHPARFTATSSQLVCPPLQVNVDGPAAVKLSQQETGNGVDVEYITALEGTYSVAILSDGEAHIPGSPFKASFTPLTNTYKVSVYTSDLFGAGTDANVHLVLVGEIGETVKTPLKSSRTHVNKFERGQLDEFILDAVNIGELRNIRIGHDNAGGFGEWHLEKVIIELPLLHRQWTFQLGQWIGKATGLEHTLTPAEIL